MIIVIQILQSILAVITNVLLRLVLIPQLIAKLQELPKQSWLKIQAAMQYLDMALNLHPRINQSFLYLGDNRNFFS